MGNVFSAVEFLVFYSTKCHCLAGSSIEQPIGTINAENCVRSSNRNPFLFCFSCTSERKQIFIQLCRVAFPFHSFESEHHAHCAFMRNILTIFNYKTEWKNRTAAALARPSFSYIHNTGFPAFLFISAFCDRTIRMMCFHAAVPVRGNVMWTLSLGERKKERKKGKRNNMLSFCAHSLSLALLFCSMLSPLFKANIYAAIVILDRWMIGE